MSVQQEMADIEVSTLGLFSVVEHGFSSVAGGCICCFGGCSGGFEKQN